MGIDYGNLKKCKLGKTAEARGIMFEVIFRLSITCHLNSQNMYRLAGKKPSHLKL